MTIFVGAEIKVNHPAHGFHGLRGRVTKVARGGVRVDFFGHPRGICVLEGWYDVVVVEYNSAMPNDLDYYKILSGEAP